MEPSNEQILDADGANAVESVRASMRRWDAAAIERRMRGAMIVATLLVIPDLIMEEQPLRGTVHLAARIADWGIWLVFLVEFAAIMAFATDWRVWIRRYPLAVPMLILTPPFAPATVQGLRAFRLLRLLRVARGFELLSKLLTLDGLKYVAALVVFLTVGGGTIFADVESHAGHHISSWEGIWWAIGTVSTTGTNNIEATTDAARAIAIVLMLTGMGSFGVLTAAIAQRFVASRAVPRVEALDESDNAILARLDVIASRLDGLEASHARLVNADLPGRQRVTNAEASERGSDPARQDQT